MMRRVMTVGEYLATPPKPTGMGRGANCCAVLSVCFCAAGVAFAVCSNIWGRQKAVAFAGTHLWALDHLIWCSAGLALTFFGLCAALHVLDCAGVFAIRDDIGSVKRSLLRLMVERARFGISLQTPLKSVGVNIHYLFSGAGMGGVRCRNGRVPFVADDLRGLEASYFGGVDCICIGGDLLIFFTNEAKRGFIKEMSKKRGRELR